MSNEPHTIIPKHVAIIMDGNGRWAEAHGYNRSVGHAKGVEVVHSLVDNAAKLGIKYLTLYAFSTENWGRPANEVDSLMELFAQSLATYTNELNEKGVRLLAIGDLNRLPLQARIKLNESIELTKNNTVITLVIALSYSARVEINQALCKYLAEHKGEFATDNFALPSAYDYPLATYLNTANIPDPDLLIRTGGELRLSNFLLYQMAYTELYFTPTLWPDFDKNELQKAITEFARRERRFGRVNSSTYNNYEQ